MKSMYDVKEDSFQIDSQLDSNCIKAMKDTWNTIAADCLVGDDGEYTTMTREEVLEVVMDANRLECYGSLQDGAYAFWLNHFHPDHWKVVSRGAFPDDVMGY